MNIAVRDSAAHWSALSGRSATSKRSEHLAPTARGLNFFEIDHSLKSLLPLYMDRALQDHLVPHLHRLGALGGGRLGELSNDAERHVPVLHPRDHYGRDEEWIEYHPSYKAMEEIGFGTFGMHAMTNRAGVLGYPAPMPPLAKFVFFYLFAQAEFGLLCPISLADCSSELVRLHGSDELKAKYLDAMLSQDLGELKRSAQFMTEKAGGSDVGANELTAVRDGDHWRLWGEKWFCSHTDADLAVLLARPEGAPAGGRGLGLFLMPKTLDDGSRNDYRIVRLKDKLGSRTMASGEIVFEGAVAYQLGQLDQGLKHMLGMVNTGRVSHAARAAGMMRRCLNEAMVTARHRSAFGKTLIDHPLLRRQLIKIMIPTEQALSAVLYASEAANRAESDKTAHKILRIMTPITKYRVCRDNVTVAGGALEVRGGNGYIEDWPNARLVRDAHLGVIWDGTSNIVALDVISRAIAKSGADTHLRQDVSDRLSDAAGLPGQFRHRLDGGISEAFDFARQVAQNRQYERFSRVAAGKLYHAVTAALMAVEGCQLGSRGEDARRVIMSRMVLEHRLQKQMPTRLTSHDWEEAATDKLLSSEIVSLDDAASIAVA
jgi:alkylation response protein AidB-like acyl-CoA dehydrogenase